MTQTIKHTILYFGSILLAAYLILSLNSCKTIHKILHKSTTDKTITVHSDGYNITDSNGSLVFTDSLNWNCFDEKETGTEETGLEGIISNDTAKGDTTTIKTESITLQTFTTDNGKTGYKITAKPKGTKETTKSNLTDNSKTSIASHKTDSNIKHTDSIAWSHEAVIDKSKDVKKTPFGVYALGVLIVLIIIAFLTRKFWL